MLFVYITLTITLLGTYTGIVFEFVTGTIVLLTHLKLQTEKKNNRKKLPVNTAFATRNNMGRWARKCVLQAFVGSCAARGQHGCTTYTAASCSSWTLGNIAINRRFFGRNTSSPNSERVRCENICFVVGYF